MRPVWKGAISFGLVNIPVKMYTAVEDKTIKFRYLHRQCSSPLNYQRVCSRCGQQVDWDEVVKGYEHQKGQFIIMEEADFEKVPSRQTRTIDIVDFCDLTEIDPIYFQKSYYLGPEETAKKAYNLLSSTLRNSDKVAVAKVVIRSKQSLAAIRVYKEVLVMETMNYPDEIRAAQEVPGLDASVQATERELEMAAKLVDSMTTPFEPDKYTDEYRRALIEIIEAKLEGHEPDLPEQRPVEGVADLMETLRNSLEAIEKEKFKPRKGQKEKDAIS